MKKLLVGLVSLFTTTETFSQNNPEVNLKVGMPCPDFVMTNVKYYKSTEVSLGDLKGKNVILDFFHSGCSGCFRQMPKINSLKEKFGDQLEVFYVGLLDSKVEKVYEKFRKAFDLKIPVTYDSVLPNRFVVFAFPEYLWIGKDGTIKAITAGEEVTEENIASFVAGEPFNPIDKSEIPEWGSTKALMLNPFVHADSSGNLKFNIDEDTICVYKSEFGRWNYQQNGFNAEREIGFVTTGTNSGRAVEICGDPQELYFTAYFGIFAIAPSDTMNYGKVYRSALLNNIDKRAFVSFRRHKYWYRLIDRRGSTTTKETLLTAMRSDLHTYFGYEAGIVDSTMPCYKIVVTNKRKLARLRSKGGAALAEVGNGGLTLINIPWQRCLEQIRYYGNTPEEPTYIDETGIGYNVDLRIEAAMQSVDDVSRALNKYGLGIVKGQHLMKVLVVSNPVKTN